MTKSFVAVNNLLEMHVSSHNFNGLLIRIYLFELNYVKYTCNCFSVTFGFAPFTVNMCIKELHTMHGMSVQWYLTQKKNVYLRCLFLNIFNILKVQIIMKKLIVNLSFCRWLLPNPLKVIKFREEKMMYGKKSKP